MVTIIVNTNIPVGDKGKLLWFPFEVEAESMAEACDRLSADGFLRGTRLLTRPLGGGAREIVRREPYMIGKEAVTLIGPLNAELREVPPVAAE